MRRVLLPLFFLAGLTTNAQADAVPMPPAACPYGSTPSTCHGGAYCAVRNCESDSDCPTGRSCKEVQACFYRLDCLGMMVNIDALRPTYNSMKSACPSSGVCAGTNKACETQKTCVTPDGTSTVTAPLTSTTLSTSTRSVTSSGSGTGIGTKIGTAAGTDTGKTGTGTTTETGTGVASASRTQNATATQTATLTKVMTKTASDTGTGTGSGQATMIVSSSGTASTTGTGAVTGPATVSTTSIGTSVASTGNQTSQQTSVATSAATSTETTSATLTTTTHDAGTAAAKLGDSGCSCRVGGWASARVIGPWLLAGVFSAVVTLLRRRRTRK
jgi:hypothetical protein